MSDLSQSVQRVENTTLILISAQQSGGYVWALHGSPGYDICKELVDVGMGTLTPVTLDGVACNYDRFDLTEDGRDLAMSLLSSGLL